MYSEGNSLIPLNHEINFILAGVYKGRTALSVILWTLGTVVFTLTTICSLGYWNRLPRKYLRYIIAGITGAGVLYLASCVAQYGLFLHGPAGVSMPIGVLILFLFGVFLYVYQDFLYSEEKISMYFSHKE
jgi:CHASE2 domain-containing sensor protein